MDISKVYELHGAGKSSLPMVLLPISWKTKSQDSFSHYYLARYTAQRGRQSFFLGLPLFSLHINTFIFFTTGSIHATLQTKENK